MAKQNKSDASGVVRKLLAVAAGALAARVAFKMTEKLWTKGLRQDLPGESGEESVAKAVAWVGLTAAVVGMAREAVRQLVAGSSTRAD
jgi:uncharacterized protein DUF4235